MLHSLQKSLPNTFLLDVPFLNFCLGDRAYGPAFCAAGRKLAVRFLQLGAKLLGEPGYGDDGTPGGGVLADLDVWITQQLEPQMIQSGWWDAAQADSPTLALTIPYEIGSADATTASDDAENENASDRLSETSHLSHFFRHCAPLTAYRYTRTTATAAAPSQPGTIQSTWSRTEDTTDIDRLSPLTATVTVNRRLTSDDWEQDTRHIRLVVEENIAMTPSSSSSLPYMAGDVVSIMPENSGKAVERFLSLLPYPLQQMQDDSINLQYQHPAADKFCVGVAYSHWPKQTTLRQWLTYCADLAALPEREDLWALSHYCDLSHERGHDQRDKLLALSDTAASALYTDYILRQKRAWADVLVDFDSLRTDQSPLTAAALISLLSPMRPREFSIASSPTVELSQNKAFAMDLTVAVVQGTTPLGRAYAGLCSSFLARCDVGTLLRVWIRPGSFAALPRETSPKIPVLYVGAGTGIAPLRGLLAERMAFSSQDSLAVPTGENAWTTSDILLFGCRKESTDFYYRDEWEKLVERGFLTLLTAFSRDQWHKFYVQQRLRQDDPHGQKLLHHLVTCEGHLYIAGGAKMARSIKEEIVELLDPHVGGKATQYLSKLHRLGRFRVEAWS